MSLDAGAEPFLLWADGAVEGVSLSRVAYQSDGTFTQTESLWSADRLESGDGLLVTAVIPEGAPNLQITWTGADGTQTRLISESGKDGSLLLIDPASMAAEAAPQALDISNLMPFSCDLDGDGTEDEISILGVAYDKDNNMSEPPNRLRGSAASSSDMIIIDNVGMIVKTAPPFFFSFGMAGRRFQKPLTGPACPVPS